MTERPFSVEALGGRLPFLKKPSPSELEAARTEAESMGMDHSEMAWFDAGCGFPDLTLRHVVLAEIPEEEGLELLAQAFEQAASLETRPDSGERIAQYQERVRLLKELLEAER